ncbi:hypothetical protein PN498_01500 [Oscillatoria sp. CS-180]|uniref:hypothetical protein n=1 Tax=Oscillatoria sp. CS-180 TaxID=3021720 RepID=UPI00232DEE89|nr:hypothetical protein [Oscillatoria sp. CS-180]MDB9524649.1 hypothetical protein [Oscillatoria sp. CS-180]
MDRQRWLLAIGVVVGLQMTVMPSSIAHVPFLKQISWTDALKSDLPNNFLGDNDSKLAIVQSSQRQTNTITLDSADLSLPHELTIETSAALDGQIVINDESVLSLSTGTTTLDVAPYIADDGATTIELTGTYRPGNAVIKLQFEGPGISISQQSAGMGQLDYSLNLEVD